MKRQNDKLAAGLAMSAAVLALAACGGGGDSTPTIKNVNVAAFTHNRLRANKQWSLQGTGTVSGQSAQLQLAMSLAAGAPAEFVLGHVTGNTSVQTVTISGAGASATTVETAFFDDADQVFGQQDNSGGCASVTASTTPLPTSAAIGASGPLLTAQSFTSCSSIPVPVSTSTETWSVENDAGVILVCENSTQVIGGTQLSGSTCLESDANGTIGDRARVMIVQGNINFTARNY